MLKDAGAWAADHNPLAGSATAVPPSRPASATPRASAAPARASAAAAAPKVVAGGDTARTSRIRFDGYDGRGWIIKNFTDMRDKQVREFKNGTFAVNPADAKTRWSVNECVHLVKYFGVPYSGLWRRGLQVCTFKPGELPAGTVIATLRDDHYHSDYSGRSHVGIYISHDEYAPYLASHSKTAGLMMCNQWNGAIVQNSPRPYSVDANADGGKAKKAWIRDGKATKRRLSWMRDGEEYFVVMTK